MGVGQKEKPSQLLKRIKLAGSCKDAGADVPLPVVVPARACRTNAGLLAACFVRQRLGQVAVQGARRRLRRPTQRRLLAATAPGAC